MVFTTRPVIMGTHGVVASTHYLATVEGLQVLREGGGVVDAGAAMWFTLSLLEPHLVGVAGEVPILLYLSDEERIIAVNGQGPAPAAATIQWFKDNGYPMIPEDGFTPAMVPGAFHAWMRTMDEYGSLSLKRVLEPAIKLAKTGFPVYPTLAVFLERLKDRYLAEWPSTVKVYLPGGPPPVVGQVINNPEWSRAFSGLLKETSRDAKTGRSHGFDAAINYFYDGPIAEAIIEYTQSFRCRDVYGMENHGLLTREDLSGYSSRFEEPVSVNYRGLDVYKCGPWTQGPVLLQILNLLEGYDLKSMGHNSVEYLHTIVEAMKLAFADREQYYADPDFVDVPLGRLLSKGYAEERRALIDSDEASMMLRPGGVPPIELKESGVKPFHEGDTVHLEAVDREGNMLSATPSGGWIRTSPLVPGLGFPLGTRGQFFHLDPNHVERLEPGKKPSTTLTPSLVLKDGKPYMVFGTPGGDQQDQWTLQLFLNHVEFGMNVQESIDAQTVHTSSFPGSFWPHAVRPGEVSVEPGISSDVMEALKKKGHRVVMSKPWSHGRCLAIRFDAETGVIHGGASPRTGNPYAMGW
jgi:gamma-glutamyltranspeptidase/glutathione hydrolase